MHSSVILLNCGPLVAFDNDTKEWRRWKRGKQAKATMTSLTLWDDLATSAYYWTVTALTVLEPLGTSLRVKFPVVSGRLVRPRDLNASSRPFGAYFHLGR